MPIRNVVVVAAASALLAGCATPYQPLGPMSLSGGYRDLSLGNDVYRISFGANGFTTHETAQTLWLWRCAELTLERGFDGFQIMSDMHLSDAIPALRGPDDVAFSPASYVVIPVPVDDSNKPFLSGDIRLLKAPLEQSPPKVFEAHALKDTLAPYVLPALKQGGNVKPHIHEYLLPLMHTT